MSEKYKILSLIPGATYENIVYDQVVEIENYLGNKMYVEDNQMMISGDLIGKKIDLLIRASFSNFYCNYSDIPVEKKRIAYECKLINSNEIEFNGFCMQLDNKIIYHGDQVVLWLTIYMFDIIKFTV